ncbi:MAG: hypothetical protein QXV06_05245 [Ignisphaera sp.]
MDYIESVRSTLTSILKFIESNTSEPYVELGQHVTKFSNSVRRLTRIRPDVAKHSTVVYLGAKPL